MNLEQNQAFNNLGVSASRNITASNDPQQMKHDQNEMLIRGAKVMVEGRSLGLNDEQVMDVALQRLGQQRANDPHVEERKAHQAAFTNQADSSIVKEAMKRGRK